MAASQYLNKSNKAKRIPFGEDSMTILGWQQFVEM